MSTLVEFPKSAPKLHHAPRIIHQIWFNFSGDPIDNNVPEKLRPLQQSWVDKHPTWRYVLWSRPKADEFLAQHFGWFLPVWQSYKSDIYRVDALRYFIMYWFGGAYIDIDAECHRPIDELADHQVVLVSTPHSKLWLSNYFIMAHKGHPFFKYCIEQLPVVANSGVHWANSFISTMTMAGPMFLTWCYMRYAKNDDANDSDDKDKTTSSSSEIHVLHHCYFGAGRDHCNSMLSELNTSPYGDHQFHSSWNAKRRAWADVVRLLAILLGIISVGILIVVKSRTSKKSVS